MAGNVVCLYQDFLDFTATVGVAVGHIYPTYM